MTTRTASFALGAAAAATGVVLTAALRRRRPRDVTAYRARTARVVTVRRDPAAVYGLWHEAFPQFFRGVEAIEGGADDRQRWTLQHGTQRRTIDVVVVDDRPGERIEWHAARIGPYEAHGLVTFAGVGTRGSEVRLALALDGPLAKTNAAFARLFGLAPAQIAAESLRAFKALAETGEIPKAVNE